MAPLTKCPDGESCQNYDASISAGPNLDGCYHGCARGIARLPEYTEKERQLMLDKARMQARCAVFMQAMARIAKRNEQEAKFAQASSGCRSR